MLFFKEIRDSIHFNGKRRFKSLELLKIGPKTYEKKVYVWFFEIVPLIDNPFQKKS